MNVCSKIVFIIVVLFLVRPIFFILALLPIRLVFQLENRKNNTSHEEGCRDGIAYNSSHNGIIGFLGRSVISYINYVGLRTGYIPLQFVRKFIYKYVFMMNVDRGVSIHYGLEIMGNCGKIWLGEGTVVGYRACLDGRNGIRIGRNVNISSGVSIYTNQHDYNSHDFSSYNSKDKGVFIGDYVWLSANSIILPGVSIGEGAVVAAGAIVTKDIEPYAVYAGIPARKVSERLKDIEYSLIYSGIYFW